RHVVANLQPSGFPVILDGGCVADAKRGSWNLLTLNTKGLLVDVYKWTNNTWVIERSEEILWTR
ncbi:MAG TPA: hypothetical protein VGM34_02200, partial [Chlamydiales bacterium]